MSYDKIYKTSKDVWGKEPNKLLQMIWQKVDANSYFLDLGCDQGRDSVFMARQGFKVVVVDESSEAIEQLKERAIKENLNIETICQSITYFKIAKDKFSIINAFNSFQFLDKGKAGEIIGSIKKNLKPNGYAIISGFTVNDPSYQKQENKSKGYFMPNELKELFNNFEIIFYFEGEIEDKGHVGAKLPHKHGVVRLITKKN